MTIGKVATHLCLTLIVKELKINDEHGRVVKFYFLVLAQIEKSNCKDVTNYNQPGRANAT